VLISGDDDDVRLRILADAHTFKVGDEANVELHWRNEPAMALVTFEGARILDYNSCNCQGAQANAPVSESSPEFQSLLAR
jgi:hypothetical protein